MLGTTSIEHNLHNRCLDIESRQPLWTSNQPLLGSLGFQPLRNLWAFCLSPGPQFRTLAQAVDLRGRLQASAVPAFGTLHSLKFLTRIIGLWRDQIAKQHTHITYNHKYKHKTPHITYHEGRPRNRQAFRLAMIYTWGALPSSLEQKGLALFSEQKGTKHLGVCFGGYPFLCGSKGTPNGKQTPLPGGSVQGGSPPPPNKTRPMYFQKAGKTIHARRTTVWRVGWIFGL